MDGENTDKLFLDVFEEFSEYDRRGWSALHWASHKGMKGVAERLLEKEASVTA
jgi:ankyrin repeat protein